MLLSNGISFAIQTGLFLFIGSFADFGSWRPWLLIIQSIVAYGVGFGWLGVHEESKWRAAVGLYIVGLIAYQLTFTFWNAAFPGLARNTPEMKDKADSYIAGAITRDEYDYADSMTRSRLANVAFLIQSFVEVVILAVIIGIMFSLKVTESEANNNWGFSVIIAFGSAIWLVVSLPWFFLEKHRPGQDPATRSILVAGYWQIWHGVKAIWKLKQSLVYLIGRAGLRERRRHGICSTADQDCRVLLAGRFHQHHRHSCLHPSSQQRHLQHPHFDVPTHGWNLRPGEF